MKASEIENQRGATRYIGKSKSWKKAWHASLAKWKIILRKGNSPLYYTHSLCGFCLVSLNRQQGACFDCPVWSACKGEFSLSYNVPKSIIDYLQANKERIFAL